MLKTNSKDQKGFTIIEVLIVLAIAGLILLIVFLAVPALQRNSRNTSIKNAAQSLLGGFSDYAGVNSGALPTGVSATGGKATYAGTNPTSINIEGSVDVTFNANTTPDTGTPDAGTVKLYTGYRCDGVKSSRAVSAVYAVESASALVRQCADS